LELIHFKDFLVESTGHKTNAPKFLRASEMRLKRLSADYLARKKAHRTKASNAFALPGFMRKFQIKASLKQESPASQ